MVSAYRTAVLDAMSAIHAARPDALFIGQTVVAGGAQLGETVHHLPAACRLELPVFENTQTGMATGLALSGILPVSIYPRIQFLMCAMDQLLHLDLLPVYSRGGYNPHVIIRTAIPVPVPLDPGPQHLGNPVPGLCLLLPHIIIHEPKTPNEVRLAYEAALRHPAAHLVIEDLALYHE